MPSIASTSLPTKIDTLLIEPTKNIHKNTTVAQSYFANFIHRNNHTQVLTESYERSHSNEELWGIPDGRTNKNENFEFNNHIDDRSL